MARSRVVNRVAAIESSSRSPEIFFQSTDESCHLSIEIPYNFACRAVESPIESPQSSRRVGLRKFPSRLMSPDSIVVNFVSHCENPRSKSRNFLATKNIRDGRMRANSGHSILSIDVKFESETIQIILMPPVAREAKEETTKLREMVPFGAPRTQNCRAPGLRAPAATRPRR